MPDLTFSGVRSTLEDTRLDLKTISLVNSLCRGKVRSHNFDSEKYNVRVEQFSFTIPEGKIRLTIEMVHCALQGAEAEKRILPRKR